MNIRPIEITDVARCQEIVRANWDEAAANRFAAEVSHVWALDMDNPPQFFVATIDNILTSKKTVTGFAGMARSMLMQGVWDFTFLAVDPAFHGIGIGFDLVEHRIRQVLAQDGRAVHLMTQKPLFFEQWSFRTMREYAGEGWHLMSLQLGQVTL